MVEYWHGPLPHDIGSKPCATQPRACVVVFLENVPQNLDELRAIGWLSGGRDHRAACADRILAGRGHLALILAIGRTGGWVSVMSRGWKSRE
jgi:hypothetical protein